MRHTTRLLGALVCGALVLAACSVESSSSTSPTSTGSGDDSHLDDGPGDLLRTPRAAQRAIDAIDEAVGAETAKVSEILIYPEFLDADAQDPEAPDHIDEYEYRDGEVGPPEAVHLSGPQEDIDASLFPTTAVDWRDVPEWVRAVEQQARSASPTPIEEARASYLIVRRSTSPDDDGRVELAMYIDGPRRSGMAELTATGEIVSLTVS
jgi:hypothetical protein